MDLEKAHNALIQVAIQKGMSLDEVMHEIDLVIREAMANPDPKIQRKWKEIPRSGDVPTAEEFVAYLGKTARDMNLQG